MNFEPSMWGPCTWETMHYIALSYPEKPKMHEKNRYMQLFTLLGECLPCKECRINFKTHLITYPIENYLGSNKELFAWTMKVRNAIRRANGNPNPIRDEDIYESLVNKCQSSPWWYYVAPIAIIGTLLIAK